MNHTIFTISGVYLIRLSVLTVIQIGVPGIQPDASPMANGGMSPRYRGWWVIQMPGAAQTKTRKNMMSDCKNFEDYLLGNPSLTMVSVLRMQGSHRIDGSTNHIEKSR